MAMTKCPYCDDKHVCHNKDKIKCCGLDMHYQEIFGIRRYECIHRSYHPVIYINMATGHEVVDESIPYQDQE